MAKSPGLLKLTINDEVHVIEDYIDEHLVGLDPKYPIRIIYNGKLIHHSRIADIIGKVAEKFMQVGWDVDYRKLLPTRAWEFRLVESSTASPKDEVKWVRQYMVPPSWGHTNG